MGKWSVGKESGSRKIKRGRPLRPRNLGHMEASGARAMISGLQYRGAGRRIKKENRKQGTRGRKMGGGGLLPHDLRCATQEYGA